MYRAVPIPMTYRRFPKWEQARLLDEGPLHLRNELICLQDHRTSR